MIDEIFNLVMKEARTRPGFYLSSKIKTVIDEINTKVSLAIYNVQLEERRFKEYEKQRADNRST